MTHSNTLHRARLANGAFRQMGWCAWLITCGIGCLGCFQSAVVPPTTSLTKPIVPTVPTPPLTEPLSPNLPVPADPIESNTLGKPEAELRDWNYIVLHHTASEAGSVESIHEEHLRRKDKNGNAWLGIGYHFVVGNGKGMPDGAIEPTFRWRQQLQGAHAGIADYNQHGIGIVLIGNFEHQPPTDAQLASLRKLVRDLRRKFGIASNQILGHSDVKATECPGKFFPLIEVRKK